MKTVKEIMVKTPRYCEKQEQLQHLVTRISKSYVGALPVIDEERKVIGIITEQDIEVALSLGRANKNLEDLMVHEVMAPVVHVCYSADSTLVAIEIMRTKKVDCLPVVDNENKLEGIININTVLNHLLDGSEEPEILHSVNENKMHSITQQNTALHLLNEIFWGQGF